MKNPFIDPQLKQSSQDLKKVATRITPDCYVRLFLTYHTSSGAIDKLLSTFLSIYDRELLKLHPKDHDNIHNDKLADEILSRLTISQTNRNNN